MAKMNKSLRDWDTKAFPDTFKAEMETFRKDVLPLDKVIGKGNSIYDGDLGVVVNAISDSDDAILARVGFFFAEVVSCCSCGENPPVDEAYCEMDVRLDKSTADVEFSVVEEYLNNE